MIYKKMYGAVLPCVFIILFSACTGIPETRQSQYTRQYYTFSILADPKMPRYSPQLDLAMALLRMEYPKQQAEFFNNFLYSTTNLDDYKDQIILEQRENYRGTASVTSEPSEAPRIIVNWRYSETINVKASPHKGLIVERDYEIYSGGAHPMNTRRYYILDMEDFRQIKIDDLFADFQSEAELREVIYDELRKYSKLERGQPLSEGIFFSDEPELSFNFFVTQEGLGLRWDPYQIAPYSEGPIEIILPWHEVRPRMLTSGIELLTKFDIYLFV